MQPKTKKLLIPLIVAALSIAGYWFPELKQLSQALQQNSATINDVIDSSSNEANLSTPKNTASSDDTALLKSAYEQQRSEVWMHLNARVVKLLSDDNEGSRHQRFILKPNTDFTVLVAHNIDLAQRVPLQKGDTISLYGRYEWTERGGVIHWTHHDPKGYEPGGWIEHQGRKYQ